MSATALARTIAQPIHDEILSTAALHRNLMQFRVRIFENPPFTVVLLTDLDDANPGCSVTNGIEWAVAAVLEKWRALNRARLVIVEHYDDREKIRRIAAKRYKYLSPESAFAAVERDYFIGRKNGETFDLVSFGAVNPITKQHEANAPHWKPSSKAEVEALIGGALP